MAKYGKPETKRPKGFFPRIDVISVYAIAVERMTGKECPLPPFPNSGLRKTGRSRQLLHCAGTVWDANYPPATFEDRGDTLDPDVRSASRISITATVLCEAGCRRKLTCRYECRKEPS
jgi:hypothetical protein